MTKDDLFNLVRYIANQTVSLKNKYIEEELPIDYLTIFSHSEQEFADMKNIMSSIGEIIDDNNGPVYRLNTPISVTTGKLSFLRIRHPDLDRPQKGCDDFWVGNYEEFKDKYLGRFSKNMALIKRPSYEMI